LIPNAVLSDPDKRREARAGLKTDQARAEFNRQCEEFDAARREEARQKADREKARQRKIKETAKRRVDIAAEVERIQEEAAIEKAEELIEGFSPTHASELLSDEPCREWLVEGLIVAGEPVMIAGPKKTYKTSFAVDLAISAATGTPFLGKFPVSAPRRHGLDGRIVVLASAESGNDTLTETMRRVAAARGVGKDALKYLQIASKVPNLSDKGSIRAFLDAISMKLPTCPACRETYLSLPYLEKYGFLKSWENVSHIEGCSQCSRKFPDKPKVNLYRPDVVIIDPLYKALGGVNTADLTAVGAVLSDAVGELRINHYQSKDNAGFVICHAELPTIIFVHHAQKHTYARKQLDLDSMAFAGTSEFTRQWFIVNWRAPFKADEPRRFCVNYGGSAGHSGSLAIDLDEGRLSADFTGRCWRTTVRDLAAAMEEDKAASRRAKQGTAAVGHADALLAALPTDGSRVSYRAARLAAKLNPPSADLAIEQAVAAGLVHHEKQGSRRFLWRADPNGTERNGTGRGAGGQARPRKKKQVRAGREEEGWVGGYGYRPAYIYIRGRFRSVTHSLFFLTKTLLFRGAGLPPRSCAFRSIRHPAWRSAKMTPVDHYILKTARELGARGCMVFTMDFIHGRLQYFDRAARTVTGMSVRKRRGGGLTIKSESVVLPSA
jgi:hypothetical protein